MDNQHPREETGDIENTGVMKAHEWQADYERSISELFSDPEHVSLEEAVNVAFQGLVARLAPDDLEVQHVRLEQHRPVWEGGREDADLYARLFYSAEFSKEAAGFSSDFSWTNPANAVFNKIMGSDALRERFFGNGSDSISSAAQFTGSLQKRITDEYQAKGGTAELRVFPTGTKATFRGISGEVEGYSPDGTLRFKADDEKDQADLMQHYKGKLTPDMFLSKEFILS